MIDPATGAVQQCFVGSDGFRICNLIVRNGNVLWTKSGKWWRFPALPFASKRRKTGEPEVTKEKTAPTSEKQKRS